VTSGDRKPPPSVGPPSAGLPSAGPPSAGTPPLPDWDAIIAHVCTCTGWSWDYAEETLTVPRLLALNAYWRSHPPAHLLLAAWLGVKPKTYENPEQLLGLMS